ncbi:MAG TPA: glycoside hydrolase family 15 protein [Woeseiaceae bacterium]|nr:glycoside hydrolase family 15 protein [Woeseiaceae bacterium]
METGESQWPADDAPGAPGIGPTWTSSAKDIVGTSLGASRLWFTVGYGIVNEVYFPRVDLPQIRDLGFIVADDAGFWCETKRLKNYALELPQPGVPAPSIVHRHERFTLTVRVVPDASRDVLLVDLVLEGDATLKPYVLLAPHLGGSGFDNIAAAGRHYNRQVLWAEQGPFGLALAAVDMAQRDAFGRMSVGYVGFSDGWQDFDRNGAMTWSHQRAGPGNVAMLGELPRRCTLGLGFGASRGAAATLAVASLAQPFEVVWQEYVDRWTAWHSKCHAATDIQPMSRTIDAEWATSRMALRCHMDKTQPGGMVASLSIPWGNTSDSRGGYHLVWPRDLVECATALLGAGSQRESRDVLRYLIATQYQDGHWNQNQWLDGTAFWHGIQLDETALPVVLAALLKEHGALRNIEVTDMIRRALGFVVRMGPISDQDRWEEDRGLNAFTLAVSIAALVAGAGFLQENERAVVLDLADNWNARIEGWLFTKESKLARQAGVAGHYMRVAPEGVMRDAAAANELLPIKNRNPDPGLSARDQVALDFLQLVRFGLRSADDPHVRDTLAVADAVLRVETPSGPGWHRYNEDGYGEHLDGSAYDGTGVGRLWPLLTGERGHYVLLAGDDPEPYLEAMCAMAGNSGMLPEQVWDSDQHRDSDRHLGAPPAAGRPSGSAMPLAWAHAEFIKLVLASQCGHTFDCPRAVVDRYHGKVPTPATSVWTEHAPVPTLRAGSDLRLVLLFACHVSWQVNSHGAQQELKTEQSLPGVHSTVLPTRSLQAGDHVTLDWTPTDSRGYAGQCELLVVE